MKKLRLLLNHLSIWRKHPNKIVISFPDNISKNPESEFEYAIHCDNVEESVIVSKNFTMLLLEEYLKTLNKNQNEK